MNSKQFNAANSDGSWKNNPILLEFFGYFQSESGRRTSVIMKEKQFTAKETDITYRALNHWTEQGLLDDDREEGKGWRKFSRLEILWVRILTELRSFGLPIERILRVKASLDEGKIGPHRFGNPISGEWEIMEFSLLEFYLASVMLKNKAAYLRVFPDGEAELLFFDEHQEVLTAPDLAHHIIIDLLLIVRTLFPDAPLSPEYGTSDQDLTDEEAEVLQMLRTGNYDHITIKRRGGKIETIELEETVAVNRKLVDILNDSDFQDVQIVKRGGKVKTITRKTLKKL